MCVVGPVDIRYAGEADVKILPELAASLVVKILKEEIGDILVFLPGEGEIKKCEALLKKLTREEAGAKVKTRRMRKQEQDKEGEQIIMKTK